jgi:predicted DNA-binding transcriptional regulator AlpA
MLAADVEARVGLPPGELARRRASGNGPRHFKLGRRTVAYFESDVRKWLAACGRRARADAISDQHADRGAA